MAKSFNRSQLFDNADNREIWSDFWDQISREIGEDGEKIHVNYSSGESDKEGDFHIPYKILPKHDKK